jgi:hypothetical protein
MKTTTTTKTPRTQRTEQEIVAAIEKLARQLQERNTRSRFLMAVQETKDRWNGKSEQLLGKAEAPHAPLDFCGGQSDQS